jgi:hypothetical protein
MGLHDLLQGLLYFKFFTDFESKAGGMEDFTGLHGVRAQCIVLFLVTVVRTSDP